MLDSKDALQSSCSCQDRYIIFMHAAVLDLASTDWWKAWFFDFWAVIQYILLDAFCCDSTNSVRTQQWLDFVQHVATLRRWFLAQYKITDRQDSLSSATIAMELCTQASFQLASSGWKRAWARAMRLGWTAQALVCCRKFIQNKPLAQIKRAQAAIN